MQPQPTKKKFYSMLGLSIFCTIFFSFLAFPGILYASKANTQFSLGNIEHARKLNKKASIWCWVSVALFLITLSLQFGVLKKGSGDSSLQKRARSFKEIFFLRGSGDLI